MNFKQFDADRKDVIERAKKSNVGAIINIGSDLETSQKAIEIPEQNPNVFAAVGLHPTNVCNQKFVEEAFSKMVQNKKVVAIGETGLDYYRSNESKVLQKEVLEKFINLSLRFDKPLIFHSRDSMEDLLAILYQQKYGISGVVHCFQGSWYEAKTILDLGLLISFTGIITFTKNQETFEVIEKTPIEKIMIETDCPYLAPEPHRGKRNEPAFVIEVAKKISEIKKIPLSEVETQTTKNAIDLFRLDIG